MQKRLPAVKREGQRENTSTNRQSTDSRQESSVQRRLLVSRQALTLQSSVLENLSLTRGRSATPNPPNSPDGDVLYISGVTARNPFAATHADDSVLTQRDRKFSCRGQRAWFRFLICHLYND